MKEASYGSKLANDIEKFIGGKITKTSDRSTLGRPDYDHVKDGIITYIETKIGDGEVMDENGIWYVQPWRAVKKDLRQYEVCKSYAKHCCVVYAIYYPNAKISAVITMEDLKEFRPNDDKEMLPYLCNDRLLCKGKGITQLKTVMDNNRREVYARLSSSFS